MKRLARLALAVLLLVGTTSVVAVTDGGFPPPICNPLTNPNCPPPAAFSGTN